MFFIALEIPDRPSDTPGKGVMSYRTIIFDANGAGGGKTAVRMDKQFDGAAELFSDEIAQDVNFRVCLMHIQIPGHGKVAVNVKRAPVLDDADVMDVDPVFTPVMIENVDHRSEEHTSELQSVMSISYAFFCW